MTQDHGTTPPARGLRSVTSDEFDALDAVGGVRGLVEATAPGIVYLVLYVITQDLNIALIASLGLAGLFVVARLIQRTPVTLAFSGIFGVAIGVFAAWRSGNAGDFYVWGLLVNVSYMAALLVSVLVRWPGVGILIEMFKSGVGDSAQRAKKGEDVPLSELFDFSWRKDPLLLRKYSHVTWLWVAMFAARLSVQGPLYFMGEDAVGALGTARLVMGVPLFALVLWLTWRIIRRPVTPAGLPEQPQHP